MRPCCPGAGQKFTAANGLVNFCSVNNGTEFNNTHRYLGPNHYTRYTRVLVPKEHPPGNVITTYGGGLPKPRQLRENYGCSSSSTDFGIFWLSSSPSSLIDNKEDLTNKFSLYFSGVIENGW